MKSRFSPFTLIIVLLLVPLAVLHAVDTFVSHRVLCTDYKGNRVVKVITQGGESSVSRSAAHERWALLGLLDG